MAYIPLLEPGDVVYVVMHDQGFHWDVLEAKTSIYADEGSLRDKILMKAGPENDLAVVTATRKPPARPAASKFTTTGSPTSHLELELRAPANGAKEHAFKGCIPMGDSFVSSGQSFAVAYDPGQRLEAVEKCPDGYVALSPPRNRGHGLMLVPRGAVAKEVEVDERSDEQKQADKERLAQANRDNASRGRGHPSAVPSRPARPPARPRAGQSNSSKSKSTQSADGPTFKRIPSAMKIVLSPQSSGSNVYTFKRCTASSGTCKETGKTAEIEFNPEAPLTALSEGPDSYVALVRDRSTGLSCLILVPKADVKELVKRTINGTR
jgi:hypothetical protein